MLAVALVVGVIAIIGLVRGDSSTTGAGGPTVSPSVLVTSSSPAPMSTSPKPTTSTPTTSPPPPPVTTAQPPPPVVAPAPAATPTEVYNVSRRRGIAQDLSTRLRRAGYPVTHVRNRIGYPLATTTVFYEPGDAASQAAAAAMVARHLGVVAAAPRPATVPASGTLIVYVTASYS